MGERPYKRLIANRKFDRASLLISEECFARDARAAAPLDYPLDELLIMHRLTQEKAIELHGCGIVRADGVGICLWGIRERGRVRQRGCG